jgi:hypothetical protein
VCEGYPWYHGSPRRDALIHMPCGYEIDLQACSTPLHGRSSRRILIGNSPSERDLFDEQ